MRHRKQKKILDRKTGPRKAMLRNLATSLILYEKIKTTKAKAKVLRPLVERLITLGKNGLLPTSTNNEKEARTNLHKQRQLQKYLYLENAIKKTFEVLAPRYKERKGGYTRIINLGRRKGDGAEMALIEFV